MKYKIIFLAVLLVILATLSLIIFNYNKEKVVTEREGFLMGQENILGTEERSLETMNEEDSLMQIGDNGLDLISEKLLQIPDEYFYFVKYPENWRLEKGFLHEDFPDELSEIKISLPGGRASVDYVRVWYPDFNGSCEEFVSLPDHKTPVREACYEDAVISTESTNESVQKVFDIIVENLPSKSSGSKDLKGSNFLVLNADTGINVSNPEFFVDGNHFTSIESYLEYMNALPAGQYNVRITAPGFIPMNSVTVQVPENLKDIAAIMNPVIENQDCPHKTNPDSFVFCGYVTGKDHNPLSEVKVQSLSFGGFTTTTDSNGYYHYEIMLDQEHYTCADSFTISYSRFGHKILNTVRPGAYFYPGGGKRQNLSLSQGDGYSVIHFPHSQCL